MKRTPPWVFVAAVGVQLAALGLCMWAMDRVLRADEQRREEPIAPEPPPRAEALTPAPPLGAEDLFLRARGPAQPAAEPASPAAPPPTAPAPAAVAAADEPPQRPPAPAPAPEPWPAPPPTPVRPPAPPPPDEPEIVRPAQPLEPPEQWADNRVAAAYARRSWDPEPPRRVIVRAVQQPAAPLQPPPPRTHVTAATPPAPPPAPMFGPPPARAPEPPPDVDATPAFITELADATTQIVRGVAADGRFAFGFYPDGNIRFVDADGGRYSGKAESARARMREVEGMRAFTVQIGVAADGRLQATFTGGPHDGETIALEPLVGWSAA